MESEEPARRTRDGCWTCKKRRKKCDNESYPCRNCTRLGLDCERGTRLVWEDDTRRDGMKRRGPQRMRTEPPDQVQTSVAVAIHPAPSFDNRLPLSETSESPVNRELFACVAQPSSLIGDWPFELDSIDRQVLDRYIQLFSKTYPTFVGPTNPFLRVLVPLSTRSRPVLDALLALCCVQSWEDGNFALRIPMLRYRSRAIRGCVDLVEHMLSNSEARKHFSSVSDIRGEDGAMIFVTSVDDDEYTHLLAICVLLMLYEKLSGETQENGTIHLQSFAQLFPANLLASMLETATHHLDVEHPNNAILFLTNLFLYNDLVRSTSLRTSTLSNFYIRGTMTPLHAESMGNRFYFPGLIARISADAGSVTDADIMAWDGRLDWLPSFALQPMEKEKKYEKLPLTNPAFVHDPVFQSLELVTHLDSWGEPELIFELYRLAACVYRNQCQGQPAGLPAASLGNLASWAITIIHLIPPNSHYETALLWPVAIVAKEFTQQHDREHVLNRLKSLEERYKMKSYHAVCEHLCEVWRHCDKGNVRENKHTVLFG